MSTGPISNRDLSDRVIAPGTGSFLVSSFDTSGTFEVPPYVRLVNVYLIAGGGLGGASQGATTGGGAGGAGGLRNITNIVVSPGAFHTITVGGAGSTSTAFGSGATAGGAGAIIPVSNATTGGSGGGGGGSVTYATGAAGTAGQGNSAKLVTAIEQLAHEGGTHALRVCHDLS